MMIKRKAGLRNYSNLSSALHFYAVEKCGFCRKKDRGHAKMKYSGIYAVQVVPEHTGPYKWLSEND